MMHVDAGVQLAEGNWCLDYGLVPVATAAARASKRAHEIDVIVSGNTFRWRI